MNRRFVRMVFVSFSSMALFYQIDRLLSNTLKQYQAIDFIYCLVCLYRVRLSYFTCSPFTMSA